MTVQLQERMTVTPCRVQMEMSRLPEDLSDMPILQECRIVQQVTKTNQKIGLKQVASGGTAGGFAGRTSFAYLADLKLDSGAVNVIFSLVNELIKALYLDKIQDSNLLKINLGIIKSGCAV